MRWTAFDGKNFHTCFPICTLKVSATMSMANIQNRFKVAQVKSSDEYDTPTTRYKMSHKLAYLHGESECHHEYSDSDAKNSEAEYYSNPANDLTPGTLPLRLI